jgi:hypothetical protein
MRNEHGQAIAPWFATGPVLIVLCLLITGVLIASAVALVTYRYSGLGQRSTAATVNVFGAEAAARGWPARTPHAKPWPNVTQWSEWSVFGARRRIAWGAAPDGRSTSRQMESEFYGWPMPVVVHTQFWWPWNDPAWTTAAKPDTGLTLEPVGVIIDTLLFSVALWLVLFGPGVLRWFWRRHRRRCTECGYNLTGNVSGRCPECGTAIEAHPTRDAPS